MYQSITSKAENIVIVMSLHYINKWHCVFKCHFVHISVLFFSDKTVK